MLPDGPDGCSDSGFSALGPTVICESARIVTLERAGTTALDMQQCGSICESVGRFEKNQGAPVATRDTRRVELTESYFEHLPGEVVDRYRCIEVRNASTVIAHTDPDAWQDVVEVLDDFALTEATLMAAGGNKSQIARSLDEAFREHGWREGQVTVIGRIRVRYAKWRLAGEKADRVVETDETESGSYKVDNLLRRIALDIEWNAKDGNLDRDLAAYRAFYDLGVIDAGVIITKSQELREWALAIDPSTTKYDTTTTTTIEKLRGRLTRGDAGGCPILVVAVCPQTV